MFVKIIVSQARHKWPITLMLWVALTALVSLYVYLDNSARFSNRSMQLIMKNMGHNLLILPAGAKEIDTYLCTGNQVLFDQQAAARMAKHRNLASKYYTSVLQQRCTINQADLILTGIEPVMRGDETREKSHITAPIAPGRARLGSAAAAALKARAGDTVEILAKRFAVDDVLDPQGTVDDYRVYLALADCQALLDAPGQINAVLAFLCLSGTSLSGATEYQMAEFARLFPDFRMTTRTRIAQGRYLARMTTSRYLYYLLALVLCIAVIMVIVTGLQEVSERTHEVGIMLAMGAGYVYVIGLYVVKLLAIALLASVCGFAVGSWVSQGLLSDVLMANTRPVTVVWGRLPVVAGLTCAVAAAAAAVPMLKLVRMDPNAVLTKE